MAQNAGVLDVYAKYGEYRRAAGYELLKKVTHWTEEMVERERSAGTGRIVPGIVLEKGFAEILGLFDFGSPTHREEAGDNGTADRADSPRRG